MPEGVRPMPEDDTNPEAQQYVHELMERASRHASDQEEEEEEEYWGASQDSGAALNPTNVWGTKRDNKQRIKGLCTGALESFLVSNFARLHWFKHLKERPQTDKSTSSSLNSQTDGFKLHQSSAHISLQSSKINNYCLCERAYHQNHSTNLPRKGIIILRFVYSPVMNECHHWTNSWALSLRLNNSPKTLLPDLNDQCIPPQTLSPLPKNPVKS